MSKQQRTVLYIHLYNLLVIHSYVVCGFPENLMEWRHIERFASYSVGGVTLSLADILHGLLRGNKPTPWNRAKHLEPDDRRLEYSSIPYDPRILFTLSQHNRYSAIDRSVCVSHLALADVSLYCIVARH